MSGPVDRTPVPAELAEWVKARVDLLRQHADKASRLPTDDQTDDWLLTLLEDLSNAEAVAKRAVWLLTAYGIRNKLSTASEIARRTGVTQTAAASRAGSTLAAEALNEIWPRQG